MEQSPKTSKKRLSRPIEEEVREALVEAGGKVREAARILGVSRGHIYRLCRDYGIEPKSAASERADL